MSMIAGTARCMGVDSRVTEPPISGRIIPKNHYEEEYHVRGKKYQDSAKQIDKPRCTTPQRPWS